MYYVMRGRNFDELIFNYCIEEFEKENELTNIEITDIMKYKLMIIIPKERIKLSVNTEVSIYVDVFYNDIDLNIILTRDKFDELILNLLNNFEKSLKLMLEYSHNKKKININYVEIAGELMRTPKLQSILKDNKIKISNSILIDECTSIGAALLKHFIYKDFPIKFLEHFYHYNYYEIKYEINYNDQKETNILLPQESIETKEIEINFNQNYVSNDKPLTIKFFFFFFYKFCKENLLFIIEVELKKILNIYKNKINNNNYPILKIKYSNKQSFSNISLNIGSEKIFKYFKIIPKGITKLENEENIFKENIRGNINQQIKNDESHSKFLDEKIELSKKLYCLKNFADKNNFKEELNEIILYIKELRNNDYSFKEIKQKLKKIKNKLEIKGYKEQI